MARARLFAWREPAMTDHSVMNGSAYELICLTIRGVKWIWSSSAMTLNGKR